MVQKSAVLTTRHKKKNKKNRSADKLEKGVFLDHLDQTSI